MWITKPSWLLFTGLLWPGDQADTEVALSIAPYVTQAQSGLDPVGPIGISRSERHQE
jgi:hypothetical protein